MSNRVVPYMLLCALVTLGVCVGAPVTAAQASTDTAVQVSTGPQTAEERFFAAERARFGFTSDTRTMRLAALSVDASDNPLGIPLSPAEAAQLRSRDALSSVTDAVTQAASRVPGYSGIWLEQRGAGAIHLRFTAAPTAKQVRALTALLPAGGQLQIDSAAISSTELDALSTRITADMPHWAAQNMTLASVGVDVAAGVVDVVIANTAAPSTENELTAVYGSNGVALSRAPLDQETGARNIRNGPLYGGEWITGPKELCTMGYAYMINDQNQYYSVTAGHCNPNGSNVVQGYGGSTPVIGQVHANASRSDGGNTYCDCAAVGPLTGALTTNQVLIDANAHYTYSTEGSYTQGERACHTGAKSYESNGGHIVCGTITKPSLSVTAGGADGGTMVVLDEFETNTPTMLGDSGSPYGNGPAFLGIQSSGGTTSPPLAHASKTVHMYLTMHIKPRF